MFPFPLRGHSPDTYTKHRCRLAGAVGILFLLTGGANAALVKSYDFDSGLGDTLGNGVDLVGSGGTVSGGRYTFGTNQGLQLTSALPSTTDYAIEVRFRVDDSVSGYNKVFDFQNLSSDIGLYFLNGRINFYSLTGSLGPAFSVGQEITLGLERSAGAIRLFLDGAEITGGPVADGGAQAVPGGNILNFFEDDFGTSQREAFVGSADFVRIHDDASTFGSAPVAIPEPTSAALLGLGGLTLMLRRRR